MIALGISDYDEVIVPSFSFISTANAPLYVGARAVFADIETETYALDIDSVKSKVTGCTKAIILVHYAGQPARDRKKIANFAKETGIYLIEDCAESMGADCGNYGDIACWSFCQNKIITTGDGGALTTNKKWLYDELKQIVNLGKKNNKFVSLGYNWRLSEMQCALGISQLASIDDFIAKRRSHAKYLCEKLQKPFDPNSVYQLFTVRYKAKEIARIKKNLKDVSWNVYFRPIHLTGYYKSLGYAEGSLPVTESIAKQVITLPMYPNLTRRDLDYIADKVWTAISSNRSTKKRPISTQKK